MDSIYDSNNTMILAYRLELAENHKEYEERIKDNFMSSKRFCRFSETIACIRTNDTCDTLLSEFRNILTEGCPDISDFEIRYCVLYVDMKKSFMFAKDAIYDYFYNVYFPLT